MLFLFALLVVPISGLAPGTRICMGERGRRSRNRVRGIIRPTRYTRKMKDEPAIGGRWTRTRTRRQTGICVNADIVDVVTICAAHRHYRPARTRQFSLGRQLDTDRRTDGRPEPPVDDATRGLAWLGLT